MLFSYESCKFSYEFLSYLQPSLLGESCWEGDQVASPEDPEWNSIWILFNKDSAPDTGYKYDWLSAESLME